MGYPRVPGVYVKGAETEYNGWYRRRNKTEDPPAAAPAWWKMQGQPYWRDYTGPQWYEHTHTGCFIYWNSVTQGWYLRKPSCIVYINRGGRVRGQPFLPAAQVAALAARPPAAEWICYPNRDAAPGLTVQHFHLD